MTTSSARINKIHHLLTQALAPSYLKISDESHKHIGHAGAQTGAGHFTVQISTEKFTGRTPIECHRLVYSALASMMDTDIHALSIKYTQNLRSIPNRPATS